jgi:hypothetical protein
LWGDSHASAIGEAVAQSIHEPGLLISMAACPPAIGWVGEDSDPRRCPAANQRALRLAEDSPQLTTIILSAFWSATDAEGGRRFWQALQATVDRLNAAGKRVIVVAGIPDPQVDVPWASAIRERFGRPALRLTCRKAQIPLRNVTVIDVSSGFCGKPAYLLYRDSNHPSRYAGLAIIAPAIRNSLRAPHGPGRSTCCRPSKRLL